MPYSYSTVSATRPWGVSWPCRRAPMRARCAALRAACFRGRSCAAPLPWSRRMRASRLLPALILASAGTVEAQRTIEVRPGRPPTIAEAVRQAHPGDRIVIRKGVYREPTIVIDRPLVLQGELGAVLDGARATDI